MVADRRLPSVQAGHQSGVSEQPDPFEMLADTVPASVARIRHFTRDACRRSTPAVDSDTVALLVSEVATNALVHGAGRVRVRVRRTSLGLRVEVHDEDPRLPSRQRATPMDEGGRGIALVEALAVRWGVEALPGQAGKVVWFVLRTAD